MIINKLPFLIRAYQKNSNHFNGEYGQIHFGKQLSITKNRFHIHGKENNICFENNNCIQNNTIYINGSNNQVIFKQYVEMYGKKEYQSIHVDGHRNKIIIEDYTILRFVKIFVFGNDNVIHIGKNCSITLTGIHIEQCGNKCILADKNTTHGRDNKMVQFELDESTTIFVGEDCMISNDVTLRSSDSHSVLDENGKRINYAKDIVVGKHCWIGMRSLILKGTVLLDNSVIGAGSTITKPILKTNVIIAGSPAKIVKENINWDRKFI